MTVGTGDRMHARVSGPGQRLTPEDSMASTASLASQTASWAADRTDPQRVRLPEYAHYGPERRANACQMHQRRNRW